MREVSITSPIVWSPIAIERIAATCFIALGPESGQALVQASGPSLTLRLPTLRCVALIRPARVGRRHRAGRG